MEEKLTTVSYGHGATNVPLEFWRCFDRLQHWVDLTPNKEMIIFREPNAPKQAITFAEFHRRTDAIASHLIHSHMELQATTNVILLGPNCLDYCIVATGLHKSGLVTVKLHPSDQDSLREWCRRTDTKAVVYHGDSIYRNGASWLRELVPIHLDFDSLIQESCKAFDSDSESLRNLLTARQSKFSADDTFAMYPTSGTTGRPKLVPHSHFSMVNSVRFRAMCALLTDQDIFFSDRPTAHLVGEFGLQNTMLLGMTLVITPCNLFAHDRTLTCATWLMGMLEEENVTSGDFFGYLIHDIIHKATRPPPACLRSALVAGSMTSSQQMERAMGKIGGISNYYGTSETAMITAVCPPWGPTDDRQSRRDTVGLPAMHMEVIVVEPNSRSAIALPISAPGEIWTRGFSVMHKYYDDPVKTREAITESGWYRTGDLGYMDANGRVTVTGRIKDLIIRAGINIIPSSIEEVLQAHPDVYGVIVLGVSDDRLGEEVAACVILHRERRDCDTPKLQVVQDLIRWCLNHGLAESRDGISYAPRYWAFLDDFPTSSSGKVLRSDVREFVSTSHGGFIDGVNFLA